MATQLVTSIILSGTDNKTLTVQDVTGDYDIVTNPTGWGTPNSDRVLFWVKNYVSKLLTPTPTLENIPSISTTYDGGDSASIETFEITGDGVYRIDSVAYSILIPSGSFSVGTVWIDNNHRVYKTTVVDTLEGATEVTDITTLFATPYPLISGNSSTYLLQINDILVCRARKGLVLLIGRNCDPALFAAYLKLYAKTIAVEDCMRIQEYYTAAKAIEDLTKLLCDC